MPSKTHTFTFYMYIYLLDFKAIVLLYFLSYLALRMALQSYYWVEAMLSCAAIKH